MIEGTHQKCVKNYLSPQIYLGLQDNVRRQFVFYFTADLMGSITKLVFEFFDVPLEHVRSLYRGRKVVEARQIAMYIIYIKTNNSLTKIGQYFDRDHSTVTYSRQTVEDLMVVDKHYNTKLNELLNRVGL